MRSAFGALASGILRLGLVERPRREYFAKGDAFTEFWFVKNDGIMKEVVSKGDNGTDKDQRSKEPASANEM